MTKCIEKYSSPKLVLDASQISDSFGCEIVPTDYKEHVACMKNLFRAFGSGVPRVISVNGKPWKIEIQRIKFTLSGGSGVRFAYQDDKINFHAESPDPTVCEKCKYERKPRQDGTMDPVCPNQECKGTTWRGRIIRLEVILIPKILKD